MKDDSSKNIEMTAISSRNPDVKVCIDDFL